MLKWIAKEVKINLKSKKNFIMLMMVFFTIFAFMSNEKILSLKDDSTLVELNETVLKNDNMAKQICGFGPSRKDMCEFFKENLNWSRKQLDAYLNNDSEFYHRYNFSVDYDFISLSLPSVESIFRESPNLFSDYDKSRLIEARQIIENNMEYYIEDYVMSSDTSSPIQPGSKQYVFESLTRMEYNLELLKNDIAIVEKHDIVAGTLFINYIQSFYLFLFVIVLLINFDMVSRDFDNGTIKTFFSTPSGRMKYFFVKIIASMITTVLIIIGPIILVIAILSIMQGIQSFKHPALYYQRGLSSFDQIVEYATTTTTGNYMYVSDYSQTISVGPVSNALVSLNQESGFVHLLNIAEVSYTTLLMFNYILLLITFLVILSFIIGILLTKSVPALIVLLGISSISILVSKMTLGTLLFKLNPFSYLNVLRIVEGTLPTTYLYGIVVVSVTSIILLVISFRINKRKNIYV